MIKHKAFDELKKIFENRTTSEIDIAAWIDRWFIIIDDNYEILAVKDEWEVKDGV